MKFILSAVLFWSAFSILTSCTTSNSNLVKVKFGDENVRQLVDEYNAKSHYGALPDEALFLKSPITIKNDIDKYGQDIIRIDVLESWNGKKYEFQCYTDIELPEKVKNAQVTFLGNQMIIKDSNSDFIINLVVPQEGREFNRTDFLPSIAVNGIGMSSKKV